MSDIAQNKHEEPVEHTTPVHAVEDSLTLAEAAEQVLRANDHGRHTAPAPDLYPHQWLWDSAFTAIGQRHFDVERAKIEILSLLRAQWHNGMVPHMIMSDAPEYARDRAIWHSDVNPYSPDGIATSGITQPPVLAEAVVQIGKKLKAGERRSWYKKVWPALLAHHQWLYADRDPHGEGLTLQVHPWETGLDNTPPWMAELHEHLLPWWVRVLQATRIEKVLSLFRRDTRLIPVDQRFDNVEAMALFSVQRRLRRKQYDTQKVLAHALFAIEDVSFNSILIRNNTLLTEIAAEIKETVPETLLERMKLTEKRLEDLWDPYAQEYFSRDFVTHRLLKESSIATLLPLYAGSITKERAAELVKLLENEHQFGTPFPVPTAPASSPRFDEDRYWQGPSWVNMNWLIIDGLSRYGYLDHAAALRETTLEMVERSGFYEYFNPKTGEGLGAPHFSWTAALALDLLHKK